MERITAQQMPEVKNENLIHLQRYVKFINSRPERKLKQKGYSTHHIYPQSIAIKNKIKDFDEDWNLVELTHREHFIAHLILFYCGYEEMVFAFHRMNNYHSNTITGKIYEKLRNEFAKQMSVVAKNYHKTHDLTGVNAPNYGKRVSAKSRAKMRNSHLGQSPSNKGKKASTETKQKQRLAKLGKVGNRKGLSWDDEHKINLSSINNGKRKITDGKIVTWLLKGQNLPIDFYFYKKIKSKYVYRYIFMIDVIKINNKTIFTETKDFFITNGTKNRFISFDNKAPFGWKKGKTTKTGFWINNGLISRKCKVKTIPTGWTKGKHNKNKYIFITDGIITKQISINEIIPDGFKQGMAKKKKQQKKVMIL